MKQLYRQLAALSFVFIVCCNGQVQNNSSTNGIAQTSDTGTVTKPIVAKVDTLFAIDAPSRIVRKIRKTKDGNLLLAAFTDVLLFDGKSFSKLPKVEGFESMDAFDALEDSKGNIWIASTKHGVFRYNGKGYTHFTTDNGLIHNRTMDIHEDKAGNIWIATMGGVSYYDGKVFRSFTTKEGLPHNDVSTIMEDTSGKIWFGTRGMVGVLNPLTSTFTQVTNKDGNSFKNTWSFIEDRNGNIWIGGEDGLWRYDSLEFVNVATEFITCLYEDRMGNIWTTSSNGSLKRYDYKSLAHLQPSPVEIVKVNTMLFRVIEDKDGNIWVGTLKGVLRYDWKSIQYLQNP